MTARKYWVGEIKHDVHRFDIDHPGKGLDLDGPVLPLNDPNAVAYLLTEKYLGMDL
jgi:hypothetical protein